ncbi:Retrovirus-related Pol polyprotein from transposon RE2 (Retro element 2) (AtRE2) [Includes: Protease RE2 [Durusdinium trenchii]|uniref:Retrovirus-related Pol polyprotein from transposon RE2 (Retro element 2) (AtRE2) n=1 Tax=Durusdinium trenchii TaxID=1381693 RepID=A0ABP0N3R6_9DINO
MPNPGEALGDPDRREADLDDDEGTSTAAEVKGRREWTEEEWREWDERWWHAGQSGWYGSPWRVEHVKDDAGAASTAPPQSKTDPPDPWQQRSYDPWSRRTSVATGQADQHFQGAWSTWWAGGYQSKGDYSDPPSWSGWNNYRLWRRALLRWNANTDVAIWRRAEKVLKTLDWDLQAKLDHLTETTLSSPSYLTEILSVSDILSGEKEDSDRRRAVRAALFEGARKPDEGLAQYALRRESQFELANRYVSLPEDIKGILLEEQSGLPRQAMQNLRVLTKGQHSYSEVKKALQILDLDEESMIKSGKTSYFGGASEVEHSESDIDDEEIFLALEAQEVDEEEALCLMADLQQDRKRTWRENKLLKAARKKDRRHFDDRSSRPSRPFNRRKMSIEEIKKGTRKSVDRSVKMNAFAYLGVAEGSASSPAFLVGDYLNFQSANSGCFLEVAAGHAIVDPGASQDLIGLRSYEKLEKRLYEVGLRTIKLEESPSKASGVGGDAKSLFMALSPCVLGGQPGVIKLTVVADDIPQLLSIGLLEYGKAIIDTGNNRIRFQAFDTETTMKRLPSGHRLVDIADWDGSDFPIPAKLSEELGLPPRAFNVPSSERRAYMAASPESVELTIEPNLRKSCIMASAGLMTSRAKKCSLRGRSRDSGRKMLILSRGPGSLEALNMRELPLDATTSRPGPAGMGPYETEDTRKIPRPSECSHPKAYEVKGANQHGTWTRCSMCQTKLTFVRYSKDNPPPAARMTKSATVETYVSKPAPRTPGASSGYLPPPMMTSETSPPPDLMPDIQRALQGQTQQLAQSTAAVMSQVMSPVIEGFHQALRCQVEEQQRAQERQDAQMQQLFLAQQRIMQQNDMTRQQGACFPALSPEEIQRLLAQGFADTRRYMQQQGINEDEDWDAIPESPPEISKDSRSSVRTDRVRLPSSTELSAQGLSNVRACSHGFLSQSFKIMEVFSPPRVTEMAKQRGFLTTEPPNFDLTNGWNTLHFEDRRQLRKTLEEQSPDLVLLSPDCRLFSVLMNVNLKRIAVEKLTREQMEALTMWHLCIQVASFQLSRGKFFLIEQPAGASSWATHTVAWLLRQKGVLRFLFDQCELGLQVSDQGLSRKATGIVTNHTGIAFLLSQYQCTKTHHHVHLESGLPKKAQTYPKNMIQVILDGLRIGASDFIGVQVGSQELVGEDSDSEVPVPQPRTPGTLNKDMSPLLTPEQKKKIQLMHLNMGHLPKEQMLSMLKAAGAKEGVMKYVKDSFNCWVKERAEMEVNSGQTILSSVGELEELVICMVACKNRWFSRGGYSPSQLVFGINPRVPTELLDDDPMHDLGWREIDTDPYDQDTAASAFTKAHHIRHRARQLCIEATSRDKIKRSSSQRAHKQREWAVGQWVYVWRRFPGTGQGHLTRARWTGPGIVVLQVGHTVWVSMRARLWKCNSDQLRPASHHESIGADLSRSGELQDLIRQGRSAKAGAVDVTAEGTPDEEDTTSDPSHDQVEPMVSPAADVPAAIQLEPTPSSETPPVETTSLLRNIREPQAAVPIEDDRSALEDTSSMSTIKEGRKRPTSADETTASKKKQTAPVGRTTSASTRSKRQISETEHLERVALRTMKRMDREEKMRRLKETSSDSAVNPQTAAASSDSVNESAVPNQLKEFQNQFKEEAPQDKKDLEEDDDLFVNSSQEPQQLLSFFELKAENKVLMARPAKPKSQEFNMHEATPAEMRGFREADAAEWRTILDLNAVKILSQEDSRRVRKETPHRILPSRFVRRKKPMPGVGQWKFKSRWCVLGHCDPDNGTYSTYSPMPTTESIAVFFQICANLKLSISFCDVKQAFCQSEPLCRPQGELYVEACPGLDLPKDTVIQLIAPVYGLEDAPIRWHQTVISYLGELGFQRSLLEPCWYYKRDNRGDIEAMILVEVDDLNVAARSDVKEWILKELSERFLFGKMEHDEADFAGRHVKVLPDRIEMHQEKYILEKIQPVKMTPGRKAEKADQLTSEEFELFRSMLYRIAWVTHQTRPEAAGVVSILASRLKEATIHDVCCLNRLAAHLRNTAQQVLTIHSFKTEDMVLIAASDAGGVDSLPPSPDSAIDNVQGAWVIMAAGRMPSASQNTKVSILSWRSSKLRRRVASTLASEALAFSQALAEVEWVQIMIRDVMYGDVLRRDWMQSLNPYARAVRICDKNSTDSDLGFVFLRLTRAGLMQQARLAESNGYTHGSSAASKAKDELLECRLGTAVRRILIASNGMAAAKSIMSMRQWLLAVGWHMPLDVGAHGGALAEESLWKNGRLTVIRTSTERLRFPAAKPKCCRGNVAVDRWSG